MLYVHQDSTCDVCLDTFSFSTPAKTPHAIDCGHVFCLECLTHLNRTSCPLCRKVFGRNRVKKLHVDQHVPGEREAALPDAWRLVQRLSRCVRGEVNKQTEELIGEAQRWMETCSHKELFSEVTTVFSALVEPRVEYKSLQERFHDQQATISSLTASLHREEALRNEGRIVEYGQTQKVRGITHILGYASTISQIMELETQLDFYRKHFQGVRELARENPRADNPASEDRANVSLWRLRAAIATRGESGVEREVDAHANCPTSDDRANTGLWRLRAALTARSESETVRVVDLPANSSTSEDRLRAAVGLRRLQVAIAGRGESGTAHAVDPPANSQTSEDRKINLWRLRAAITARGESGAVHAVETLANSPTSEDRHAANVGLWRLRAATAARVGAEPCTR